MAENAGDVNGDGIPDTLVGDGGQFSDFDGAVFVIYGRRSSVRQTINPQNGIKPGQGYRIDGPSGAHAYGSSVANVGDVNGDGVPDALIGNGDLCDGVFLVYGQRSATPQTIDLDTLTPAQGVFIFGGPGVSGGCSIGDVNGDGIPDAAPQRHQRRERPARQHLHPVRPATDRVARDRPVKSHAAAGLPDPRLRDRAAQLRRRLGERRRRQRRRACPTRSSARPRPRRTAPGAAPPTSSSASAPHPRRRSAPARSRRRRATGSMAQRPPPASRRPTERATSTATACPTRSSARPAHSPRTRAR